MSSTQTANALNRIEVKQLPRSLDKSPWKARDFVARQAYPADISTTRAYRSKVGASLSWDQELTDSLGALLRLSWNDAAPNLGRLPRSIAPWRPG
jgi:hypothetical protein